MERNLTKSPMVSTSIRMPRRDIEMIFQGARIEGISRAEFLRKSSVERAKRVIRKAARERANPTNA
jgi:hypothetical protein